VARIFRVPEPVNDFETLGGQNLRAFASIELTGTGGLIGLLIQAAVGSAGGVGTCRTKRSGCAAYASWSTIARRA
jgi:hypothetical protein